jgi:hypothetical protein
MNKCEKCEKETDDHCDFNYSNDTITWICFDCHNKVEYLVYDALLNQAPENETMQRLKENFRDWRKVKYSHWSSARKKTLMNELEALKHFEQNNINKLEPELKDTKHYTQQELTDLQKQYQTSCLALKRINELIKNLSK